MKSCHECEKLNSLLGKKITIKMWHGEVRVGMLRKADFGNRYIIKTNKGDIAFYKSHITSVTEI